MNYDSAPIAQALRQIAEALSGLAQTLSETSDAGQTPPMTVDQPTLTPDPSAPSAPPSTPIKPDETTAPREHEPERPGIRIRDNGDDSRTTKTPPAPTAQDVHDALTALCAQGHSEAIRALVTRYGATTLSEVDPQFYSNLLAEANSLTSPDHSKEVT